MTIDSLRTGNFQFSYDSANETGRLRSLTTNRYRDLKGESFARFFATMNGMLFMDSDYLGSKPSIRLCKVFDRFAEIEMESADS